VVSVTDSGVGIEPEMLEELFEPFTQASRSVGRNRGGLGLGLALVRGLVESHGGRVEARSSGRGSGSTFSIRLPLLRGSRARLSEPGRDDSSPSARPRRILVVEDNPDASESLQRLLTLWGHDVVAVSEGQAAVDRARKFRPEVVLCDLKLTASMDGYAVASAVRQDAGLAAPFLIALTGLGSSLDRDRSFAAGFDRHITKPADLGLLRRLLDGELGGREEASEPR
jgi:CheY-like chemotaxis protein